MKKFSSYILTLAAGAAMVMGAVSCDDNFTRPPMVVPTTDLKPNVSILDFKTRFWQNDKNYVAHPGNFNAETGEHIVIRGRVVSSNESGNIYNNIVIQDETAAITIAVRTGDMTTTPLFGQNICVDVTGLEVGGYNGLMQLGAEGTYNGAPSMTFMEGAVLDEHYGPDGLPSAAAVDTAVVTISELQTLKGSAEGLIAWQSRIVRLENVAFEDAGQPYNNGSSTVSRYVKDAQGGRMILRISNYADFARETIPAGEGSVTGILSYYGSDWQLLPIDFESMAGFQPAEPSTPVEPGTPVQPGTGNGSEASPYSVGQIIGGASGSDAWVKGYIVGFVPDKTLAEGIFGASGAVATNLLISDTPDATSVDVCIPVQLPSGSDARSKLNLLDNPGNLGKLVELKGSIEKYFGVNALKSVSAFKLEGGADPEPPVPSDPVDGINENFDSSTSIPAGWTQVQVAGNKSWYVPTFNGNNYAAMTGYKGTAPFDQWLLTPAIDMSKLAEKSLSFDTEVNGYGSTTSVFEVYVLDSANPETAALKTKLSPAIAKAPASGYSDWVASGALDLSAFSGTIYIAFRYSATQDANYATWCVDNVIVK
ncbi:MAG: choice-of-anchor J domain-containing protein [Muribaculaceae bacterium]|nr:choice-of-anchor J domain-containing protein [Muribaculaceae bacterium]